MPAHTFASMLLDHHGRRFPGPRPNDEAAARIDSWANYATGIGTSGDKTRAGRFEPVWRLWDPELTALFNGNDICRKIVEKRPREMFRRGYELECAGVDKSALQDFREMCRDELFVDEMALEAMIWGRCYGGALLIVGAQDGQTDLSQPLAEERVRDVTFLNQVDRRYLWANSYYADPLSPLYGRPETYLLTNGVASAPGRAGAWPARPDDAALKRAGLTQTVLHETRVIRFGGRPTEVQTRQLLGGWDYSVLQLVYDVVRNFDHSFDSATYLLSDAAQGVLKMKDLMKAIASGKSGAVMARAMMMEQTRSVMRSVVIDESESYDRQPTPLAGVPEMLDRLMQRVAAAADMPVIELFGAGAGGLNAAGEADAAMTKYYDTIESGQKNELGPILRRLYRLLGRSSKAPATIRGKDLKFGIKFAPLESPTDAELADTRLKTAQRDQIYVTEGIVQPEVVTLTLTELYPQIDVEAVEAAMKGAVKFDPYENEPEPEPPALSGEPQSPEVPIPLAGATGEPAPEAKA